MNPPPPNPADLPDGSTQHKHQSDLMDLDRDSRLSPPTDLHSMLTGFSFGSQQPRRVDSFLDTPIEDIAPDSKDVSALDLSLLASQFGQANLATTNTYAYPSPSSSRPSINSLDLQMRAPSLPTHQRRNNASLTNTSLSNARRAQRQSSTRYQPHLSKMNDVEAYLESLPTDFSVPELNFITPSTSKSPSPSHQPDTISTETIPEDPTSPMLSYRRSRDMAPRANYIQKRIRVRKERAHRRRLIKPPP
ncbi:hypothetical protein BT63DRAFT_284712 [Microthyrium microscopicum]|uniref:Uncharacterized protein n=1 Tax=Microthyrium microscopicum TaxID=703497 RepID=A0A6A6U8Z9_9PEZI|nr:hypothetical protein BT63DRAFT_284712 [Microthyrium microscopicum]